MVMFFREQMIIHEKKKYNLSVHSGSEGFRFTPTFTAADFCVIECWPNEAGTTSTNGRRNKKKKVKVGKIAKVEAISLFEMKSKRKIIIRRFYTIMRKSISVLTVLFLFMM